MENTTLAHHLLLAGLLFVLGLTGVLVRRNLLVVYMCLELMLAAATLALVAFSRFNRTMDGAVLVFFVITVAAAEVYLPASWRDRVTHEPHLTLLGLAEAHRRHFA